MCMGHEQCVWDMSSVLGTWVVCIGHEQCAWDMGSVYGT